VAVQIAAKRFIPFLYWATIIASTTAGTTMATLPTAHWGLATSAARWSAGLRARDPGPLVSVAGNDLGQYRDHPEGRSILLGDDHVFANSGHRAGGLAADGGLGFGGGALVFSAALALVASAYFWTKISRVGLFWAAFILTRPLGATVGDFFDKPHSEGAWASADPASAIIAVVIIACILLIRSARANTRATRTEPSRAIQRSASALVLDDGGLGDEHSVFRSQRPCPRVAAASPPDRLRHRHRADVVELSRRGYRTHARASDLWSGGVKMR